jgi:hypothetical protein
MLITLKTWRIEYEQRLQKLISLHWKMSGTKSNYASICAGQQMEHKLHLHMVWKTWAAAPHNGVRLTFGTLSLTYQYIYVTAHTICKHPAYILELITYRKEMND